MARALSVLADLSLTLDGEDVAIRGDGDRVIVDLPSVRAGRALLRAGSFSPFERRAGLAQLNTVLRETELTVNVRYAGETVVCLGAEAQPNAVARLLDLDGVEVHPTRTLRAAVRRRPGLTLGVAATAGALIAAFVVWRSRTD